jgi:hypothetical protein
MSIPQRGWLMTFWLHKIKTHYWARFGKPKVRFSARRLAACGTQCGVSPSCLPCPSQGWGKLCSSRLFLAALFCGDLEPDVQYGQVEGLCGLVWVMRWWSQVRMNGSERPKSLFCGWDALRFRGPTFLLPLVIRKPTLFCLFSSYPHHKYSSTEVSRLPPNKSFW